MAFELYKSAARYMRHSYKILRNHGLKDLFQALHRRYIHHCLPEKTRFLPTAMEVEITTHCNLNCSMCRSGLKFIDANKPKDMAKDRFSDLLDHLGFLNLISFRGAGEPTLHPQLTDLVKLAVARGKEVRLSTNGTRLSRSLGESLIEAPIKDIAFSIDAGTPETYASIRKGGDLHVVLENLKTFGELIRRNKKIKLMVVFVVMRSSFRELPVLAERLAGLGVSCIIPKLLNPGSSDEAKALVLRNEELAEFLDILKSLSSSRVPVAADEIIGSCRSNEVAPCMNPWESPFITVDGNLSPCPSTYYNDGISIGNVLDEGFSTLWNNDAIQAYRRGVAEGNNPYCNNCPTRERFSFSP
jgi:MoaA/NifB/PqqE/SkfB family radical SAM enzyme